MSLKHYRVKIIYFWDAPNMVISGDNTDPHIEVVDDIKGIFNYSDQGEGYSFKGMELEETIKTAPQKSDVDIRLDNIELALAELGTLLGEL